MKDEYDFSAAERGKFFRKRVRLVAPQTVTAKVVMDRGSPVVILPEEIHIEHAEMRVSRYGKKVILFPIKKKRAPKK